jgi:hypothetical protein
MNPKYLLEAPLFVDGALYPAGTEWEDRAGTEWQDSLIRRRIRPNASMIPLNRTAKRAAMRARWRRFWNTLRCTNLWWSWPMVLRQIAWAWAESDLDRGAFAANKVAQEIAHRTAAQRWRENPDVSKLAAKRYSVPR